MFRGDLLIDGYNLLHAAGFARASYGPGEFEKMRRRLLKLLAEQLFDKERRRTTVVFDAPQQSMGPSPPQTIHGIRVMFAGGDGDADAEIEQLIRHNSAPKRLHVVSSDHRIQRAARRRKAKAFDSAAFLVRIARRPTPDERQRLAEPPEKRDGLTSAGEVEAWLAAFSDVQDVPSSSALPRQLPSRQSATPDQPPSTGADVTSSKLPPEPDVPRDELDFWQARIAELWQRTDE